MTKIAEKMNPYLSDLVVMYLKLHDLHWNVKGKMFVQVHTYTESRYEDMAEKFDEIAELMIMHGEAPVSSMKKYMELATVAELDKGVYTDEEVLKEVLKDLTYLKDKATELRAAFDAESAFDVVAVLEDHVAGYAKEIWFLNSMMA